MEPKAELEIKEYFFLIFSEGKKVENIDPSQSLRCLRTYKSEPKLIRYSSKANNQTCVKVTIAELHR
ncbi:unnamed protein product [Camellia sinensis]